MMSQRILVTGGAGFIGLSLVERLLNEGHRVVVLDNLFRGHKDEITALVADKGVVFIEGDVRDETDIERCFEVYGGIDLIHHLAAINGTKWFHDEARMVIDVNINGTLNIINKAELWQCRVVLASSPEAVGDASQMPLSEATESVFHPAHLHQRFSYGASKYLDEIALQHAVRRGLDGRIVRPFNAYGRRMVASPYGQVIGIMFQAVMAGEALQVHGDGSQTRSFTHIDDIVDGFYKAGALDVGLDGASLRGACFNLGSTEEVSIRQLAEMINHTVASRAVDIALGGGYPGDNQRRVPDPQLARRQLGWESTISLEQGLAMMWQALRTQP